jgi:hypothetical protein
MGHDDAQDAKAAAKPLIRRQRLRAELRQNLARRKERALRVASLGESGDKNQTVPSSDIKTET